MKKQLMLIATTVSLALGAQSALAQPVELGKSTKVVSQQKSTNLFDNSISSLSLKGDPLFETLVRDATVMSAHPIGLNTDMLDGSHSEMTLNLSPGMVFKAKARNTYWLNSDYQVWAGEVNSGSEISQVFIGGKKRNANSAVFVRNGERVFGEVRVDNRVFNVQTTASGQHILTEVDMSLVPTGDDTPTKVGNVLRSKKFFGFDAAAGAANNDSLVTTAEVANPTVIRVLQTATDAAINALGGVTPTVDRLNFFLAQSNDVYANNGLAIRLESAGLFRAGAPERPFMDQNLDGLANPSDGFMDTFAGATRNSRAADIVTVMTSTSASTFGVSLCGIADAIAANANQGFFAISTATGCANGFTFVHELAHLFGARHDNDPTTTPFAFGHGFVNAGAGIRTIMAVNSNPQTRVGFFSTDDQTFQGNVIGNGTVADNERVHDIRRNTMAGFR
ncbi:hypothetical protein EYS14_01175 [Alteromonadaceae bacterium M269]|nr:hypothetical protein EYS14_01175 [Alteromonadaceae bacterium M269]